MHFLHTKTLLWAFRDLRKTSWTWIPFVFTKLFCFYCSDRWSGMVVSGVTFLYGCIQSTMRSKTRSSVPWAEVWCQGCSWQQCSVLAVQQCSVTAGPACCCAVCCRLTGSWALHVAAALFLPVPCSFGRRWAGRKTRNVSFSWLLSWLKWILYWSVLVFVRKNLPFSQLKQEHHSNLLMVSYLWAMKDWW